ncbi:MAG: adenosylmethionine decarboxylase [Victivallales bacterium]|nr:adenosylmethionine decarboxylase [Victivallales bacterium]
MSASPSGSSSQPAGFALGKHMTVEYYDCASAILTHADTVKEVFLKAARDSGATVIGADFHYFQPQGISGFVIIAESHFSVHAWPEFDYAAVDIFTCGEAIDFQAAVNSIRDGLQAGKVIISAVMNRGITANDGMAMDIPLVQDKTYRYALSWQTAFRRAGARGISCNIDLYDVAPETIGKREELEHFTCKLAAALHPEETDQATGTCFATDDNGDFNLHCRCGALQLSGRILPRERIIYLDLFNYGYFEPREAAEFAMEFFRGQNYRMQVALRR